VAGRRIKPEDWSKMLLRHRSSISLRIKSWEDSLWLTLTKSRLKNAKGGVAAVGWLETSTRGDDHNSDGVGGSSHNLRITCWEVKTETVHEHRVFVATDGMLGD